MTTLKRLMATGIAAASIIAVPAVAAHADTTAKANTESSVGTQGLDLGYCQTYIGDDHSTFGATCYGVPLASFTVVATCESDWDDEYTVEAYGTIGLGVGSAEGHCYDWDQVTHVDYHWN